MVGRMPDIRVELYRRAFLFDDPAAYCAGVDAALAAVGAPADGEDAAQPQAS